MRKLVGLFCAVSLLALTSCAQVWSPATGVILTDLKGPIAATGEARGSKKGTAECTTILGWVALGDCSIETAAKNGGIKKISTVDHQSYSILGLFGRFTTIVTGD